MEKLAHFDWTSLLGLSFPILILFGTGLAIVLATAFSRKTSLNGAIQIGAGLALAAALFFSWKLWMVSPSLSLGSLLFDRLSFSLDLILLLSALLTLFLSKDYLPSEGIRDGEYYALLLFATGGTMLIAHGGDLIVIFLGLEIASLAVYILAGFKKGIIRSYEASLKYFIMGSIASGFLVYGIAMAYGVAGTTALSDLQNITIPPANPTLVFFAVALLMIGVCFKIAAVPFHLWSPDVYEGAPTSVTAFMASAIKVAGFAILIRLVLALGHVPQIPWTKVLWALAALTMTVGNLVALRQTNITRMLAFSSLAHAGYALVGLTAALQKNALAEATLGAVLFYLFAYSLMTIGAFAVVIAIGRRPGSSEESGFAGSERNDEADEMTDYAGLAGKHPFLAAAMAVFLFSLPGIPPLVGFVGKFYLFAGAIEAGLYGLVIIAVLNSCVSAYYYLGPIIRMYFHKEQDYVLPPLSYTLLTAIFLCLFVVVYLGIFPSDIFLLARESFRELVF